MLRALQTAQPVGRALGIEPEVWVNVHELSGMYLDHGEPRGIVGYPGMSRSEMLAQFPDYVLPDGVTDHGWWRGGREESPAWYARAIQVADEVRGQAASSDTIAIISHGGFIDILLKAILNLLPTRHLHYLHHNTAISAIDFEGDGSLLIRFLNRVDHLAPDDRS
jgi:broad specificity phosphatase PhoE